MIRVLVFVAGEIVVAALIIAAAMAFLIMFMPAVQSAEPCRGTIGLASWYGLESGTVTANGERFTGRGMTAASRGLPFGTRLRVTWHGQAVIVRINDRGPALKTGRFLDLSREAASRLGMIDAGVAKVCAERLP